MAEHRDPPPPFGDTSAELAAYVKRWRYRLKVPEDYPGMTAWPARKRPRNRVSQVFMAFLMDCSPNWYINLEAGKQGIYSDDLLNRAARAFRLSLAEREVLFRLALDREPPPVHTFSTDVSDTTRRVLDTYPFPAYVSDVAWDVVAWNSHVNLWFPWLPVEPNVMRWVFTYPEARYQLFNWLDGWARPMVAQMRYVHTRYPDNERLNKLITEILKVNPDARRLWDGDLEVKMHPDGDRRQMYVPGRGTPVPIEIKMMVPPEEPSQRLILLVPLSTDANPGIVVPYIDVQARDVYPAGPGRDAED